jgi:hypothetical protein
MRVCEGRHGFTWDRALGTISVFHFNYPGDFASQQIAVGHALKRRHYQEKLKQNNDLKQLASSSSQADSTVSVGSRPRRAGRPRGARTKLLVNRIQPVLVGLPQLAFLRMRLEGIDPRTAWLLCIPSAEADGDLADDKAGIEQQRWKIHDRLVELAEAWDRSPAGGGKLRRQIEVLRTARRTTHGPGATEVTESSEEAEEDWEQDADNDIDEHGRAPRSVASVRDNPTRFRADFGASPSPALAPSLTFERSAAAQQVAAVNAVAAALGPVVGGPARIRSQPPALPRPAAGDPLSRWLAEPIARRLASHRIDTVAELVQLVRKGRGWHRDLPRIGSVQAARIEAWVSGLPLAGAGGPTEPSGGRSAPSQAADLQAWSTWAKKAGVGGLVEFVRSVMAAGELPDAGHARLRGLAHDWEWLRCRVGTLGGLDATQLARRKQGERFVLWLHLVHWRDAPPIQLAELTESISLGARDEGNELVQAYRAFLGSIPASWIGGKAARRSETEWRPFRGALSQHSQTCAIGAVRVVLGCYGR